MPKRSPRASSPKSKPHSPAEGRRFLLGIDLGATKVVALLLDERGRIVRRSGRFTHSNDGPEGVISTVVRAVRVCVPEGAPPPRSAGIAVAAQVDPRTG
ncbi:MAG: hypothetical protein ABSB90_08355, partial [Thermoplasmata archaeon]